MVKILHLGSTRTSVTLSLLVCLLVITSNPGVGKDALLCVSSHLDPDLTYQHRNAISYTSYKIIFEDIRSILSINKFLFLSLFLIKFRQKANKIFADNIFSY